MEVDRLEEARESVRELLALNEEEREQLEAVLAGLDGVSPPRAAFPRREQMASPVLEVVRPTGQVISRRELRKLFLAEVARSPGITVTQASLRLQTTRGTLAPVVKQILAEKLISKKGACYSLVEPEGKSLGIPMDSDSVAHRPQSDLSLDTEEST